LKRRYILRGVFFVAAIAPREAFAHGDLSGLGGFYGGLLHPLVVPSEVLAVLAVGLLFGGAGRKACRLGLIVFAGAVSVGLLTARFIDPSTDLTTSLLLAVALVAGVIVAAGIHIPSALVSFIALAAGAGLGIDAAPEAETIGTLIVTSAATVLGSTLITMVVAVLVLDRNIHWQTVAMRIAGSWIAACSILYFGWLLRTAPAH
jgi:hypothetical protein